MSRVDCYVGEAIESNQVPVEYEIPQQVVREAIVNAVAHRDYTSNGSVQVMLFRNRFEVWNPGRLPSSLTIRNLYEPHSSIPANPLIAEEMYRAGYIEKAGSGTIDMINRCRESEIPEPVFSTETGQFTISFRRKSSQADQVTPHVTPQVPLKINPHDKMRIDTPQNRLVTVLTGEMSRNDLMTLLDLRDRKSFMNNYIEAAINSGDIEMTIPGIPTHKDQKYRLTEMGTKRKNDITGHDTGQVTPHVPHKINPQDKMDLSLQQIKLLSVLQGELSRSELIEALELSDRKSFVSGYLNPSLEAGLVERTIPGNIKNKNQKYRLTEKGKKMKAEIEK